MQKNTILKAELKPDIMSGPAIKDGKPKFFRAVVTENGVERNFQLDIRDRIQAAGIRDAVMNGELKEAKMAYQGTFLVKKYTMTINGLPVGTSSEETPIPEPEEEAKAAGAKK